MKAKADANLREMKGKIKPNNEKFEVLRGTLVSWMDIHQARTESTQEEMKAKIDIRQKKMEAAIHSIWSGLEETIKCRVEDALSCVGRKTQGHRKELTEKIDETQVGLQAIRTSVDTRTKSIPETITDTREHLHQELSLMIQVKTQMTKTIIDARQRALEAKIAEVEARAESGSCQRTGTGAGLGQTQNSSARPHGLDSEPVRVQLHF
jgi:hypothetical protein